MERHIFIKDKAPWFDITDDLPQFENMPSDRADPK
jgi:hypothetical protein